MALNGQDQVIEDWDGAQMQRLLGGAAEAALHECALSLMRAAGELEKSGEVISGHEALRGFAHSMLIANATIWGQNATQH